MLYLVGTPIGNLSDITLRALETLRTVDLIAAEDTRHSLRLLGRYEIQKPLVSFHEHNEARRTQELVGKLQAGLNVALITDAGLPSISDPGARLVRACVEAGLPYTVIPGTVGRADGGGRFGAFGGTSFFTAGFCPRKAVDANATWQAALERAETTVFFESPHRLERTLEVLARLAPERAVCVARELTKQFEEFRRGRAGELCWNTIARIRRRARSRS